MVNVMDETGKIELTALLIQPRGTEGANVYTMCYWPLKGSEKQREVDKPVFDKLMELAGEPTYTEPNYWQFDDVEIDWPIQWDDVINEDRVP